MKTARGFTLLETMVVLVIIGILAGMTVPSLVLMTRKQKVASEAATLVSTFSAMRTQALARGYPTVVCVRGGAYASAASGASFEKPGAVSAYRKFANPLSDTAVGLHLSSPSDTVLERRLMDPIVKVTLPTAVDATNALAMQVAYDIFGGAKVFVGATCDDGSDGTRTLIAVATSVTLKLTYNTSDPSVVVSEDLEIRRDGTVVTP